MNNIAYKTSLAGFVMYIEYMQTPPDYLGVSQIRQQSPRLPYGSPNFPDKSELRAFLCPNLEFIPCHFLQNMNFFLIQSLVSRAFSHVFHH